jgi:hypothetical protein
MMLSKGKVKSESLMMKSKRQKKIQKSIIFLFDISYIIIIKANT